jgi:precorrin-2 dehydrogenase/sirohydrochlorin ferrochelatase
MLVEERNNLYPIFLKAHQLEMLIVGGGKVGLEKLSFLLKSSPHANVQLVAPEIDNEIHELAKKHQVNLVNENFDNTFLGDKHLVIVATDDEAKNIDIYNECKSRNLLVNLADNPRYCDFYLGGIVTKGNVKIAISTNGKSPTTAKRLRQFFEEVIPENIDDLVQNLNTYRKSIKGNFEKKVSTLNELTKILVK